MEKDKFYKKIIYSYRNDTPLNESTLYIDNKNYLNYEEIKFLQLINFNETIEKRENNSDKTGVILPKENKDFFKVITKSFKNLNNYKIITVEDSYKIDILPKVIYIFELSDDLIKIIKSNNSINFKFILTEENLRALSYTFYLSNLSLYNISKNPSIKQIILIILNINNKEEEKIKLSSSESAISNSNKLCRDTLLFIKGNNNVVLEIPELIFLFNCKTISKSFLEIFIDSIFIKQNFGNHLGVKIILLEKINFSSKIIINYLKCFNKNEIEDSIFRFIFPIELLLIKGKGNFEKLNFFKKRINKIF